MFLAAAALLYSLYAGALFLFQQQLIYPTHLVRTEAPARLPDAQSEQWLIATADGDVEAWLLKPLRGDAPYPVIVHTHGNGDLIDFLPPLFRWPRERGFGVLLVEYPGYGRSAGSPGQQSIHAVLLAAYDELTSRDDVDSRRIIGYGWSLGGGAIGTLVGERDLAGLIMRSTFSRMADFAHRHAVPAFLLRDRYDNLAAVRRYDGPKMVLHGNQDQTIPYSMGQRVAEAAGVPLHTFECGHNGCPPDEREFWHAVEPLLQKIKN